MKQYYVYMLSNFNKNVLYTGVTSDLVKRVWEHKTKITKGFTSRYNIDRLIYYEFTNDVNSAISREKRLKKYKRLQKIKLIEEFNPSWKDLYEDICN